MLHKQKSHCMPEKRRLGTRERKHHGVDETNGLIREECTDFMGEG